MAAREVCWSGWSGPMHSGIPYSKTGKGDSISNSKASSWQEILFARAECCKEFRDTLLESRDQKLVETVRSDRFWSCGLTPSEAQTTKHLYYPGDNHLGRLLDLVRAHLIKQIQNEKKSQKSMPTTSSTLEMSHSPPTPPSQSTNSNNDIPRHVNSTSSSHLDVRSESTLYSAILSVKGKIEHTEVTSFQPSSPPPPRVEFTTPSTKKVIHKKTRKSVL